MEESRFDRVVKTFGLPTSRRSALGLLSAFGLGSGGALRVLADVGARKKRKNKKKDKKPKPNAFGCFNVGQACRGNSANCCSGICEGTPPKKGKKDQSRCMAHNALDCPAGADSCLAGVTCGTNDSGVCFQTTGKASFCGDGFIYCAACTKDVECEPLGGPGAACITCPGSCQATGNTFCIAAAN